MEISGLSTQSLNHGCTLKQVDPFFLTTERYNFKYIEDTVYKFSQSDTLPHWDISKEGTRNN
jgi:hypothetical protein